MNKVRDYDSTVARIAGNILSGLAGRISIEPNPRYPTAEVQQAVYLAREIVAELRKIEAKENTINGSK